MATIAGLALLVVEFVMFIAGASALIKGALPEGLLKALFGRGEYRAEAQTARLFGLLLTAPFLGLIFASVFADAPVGGLLSLLQFVLFIVVLLITIGWARRIRNANKA